MLQNRLKIVTALALVCLAGSLGFWQGFAAVSQDRGKTASEKRSIPPTESSAKAKAPASGRPYRLRGVVRVEGTGEPVPGVKLRIRLRDAAADALEDPQLVVTGHDGCFSADMAPGNVILLLSEPPPGFWIPSNQKLTESIVFGPNQPLADREFHVRKGTIWNFRFTRGVEGLPHLGYVVGSNRSGVFLAAADNDGRARLTLPIEGGKATLRVQEDSPLAPPTTGFLTLDLEWGPNFRPDELEDVVRLGGNDRRFRLTDADANSATIQGPDSIQPVKENGGLVIRVVVPDRRAQDVSSITGQIVDADGRPVPGARVVIAMGGGAPAPSNQLWHRTTTDALGHYRLREIPRTTIDGKPLKVALIVSKEGYVGIQSPLLNLAGASSQKPQVIEPIRLENGVRLTGVVVDHRGQPAALASVRASFFVRLGQRGAYQAVRTDENGRFTFGNLPRHVIALTAFHGEIFKSIMIFADGSPDLARIQLPAGPREFPADIGALRAAPPDPPAVGQEAPELEVGRWSDRLAHRLAVERGKVVVLYFWGISFDPSVCILPALGRLAKEFAPPDAVFLAIHNAEREPDEVRQQAGKVLAFKGAPLPFAVDQMRVKFHARGVTADRYGQKMSPPFVVIIDRAGKIAFHSEFATGDANLSAIVRPTIGGTVSVSEEQLNERIERALRREIERVFK